MLANRPRVGRVRRFLAAWVAVFSLVLVARAQSSAPPATQPAILLTGFEPFGEAKPPNPSWEAIKDLDGAEWNGRRLVARQLPVVWGEPLERIADWAAREKPVAVFAFGQGRPGGFSIETLARNRRAPYPDNLGATPKTPNIVDGGPDSLPASIDAPQLVKALAAKGYAINASTDAGGYLCEETLYALEHLKANHKIDGPVMFCHVPPLGSKIRDQVVDADYVAKFVKDLLMAWNQSEADSPRVDPQLAPAAAAQPAPAPSTREREVKAVIEHYFKVWSDQDMDAYDDCFMTDASIQYVDGRGQLFTTPRQRFVASQREIHRRAAVRSIEVPETIEIRFEQEYARAVVSWKLTAGDRVQKGYDHFTLKRDGGRWRIVNLLFYSTSDNAAD